MKLPAELNPRVEQRMLSGGTPVFDIVLDINGEDHTYTVTELSDYATINVLLKAMDDGWGETWENVATDTIPVPSPLIPIETDEIELAEVPEKIIPDKANAEASDARRAD